MAVIDVKPDSLIKELAKDLKQKFQQPAWTQWVKTGSHVERAPQNNDWWFERTASILYRVYRDGPVGTQSLRTYYGGRKNRGVKPQKKVKSSGKIIRTCLQTLEKENLIKKAKTGRIVTGKGESYLQKIAKTVKHEEASKPKEMTAKKEEPKDQQERETRDALRQQQQKEKEFSKQQQKGAKQKQEKKEDKNE